MAFHTKTDYCGLHTVNALLVVRDSSINGSQSKYQPQGSDGSFLTTEVYGADTAPANSYGVSGDLTLTAGAIKLNKVTTVDNVPYALEKVSITTGSASAPKVTATCQEIETGATDTNQDHYSIPAFSLSTKQKAQVLFSAFTLSGTGCVLTSCSAEMSCTVTKDKIAGVKIASDCNSGVITVSGDVLQTGDTAPTLTAAEGWTVTKLIAPTENNAETAYKTYSFEVQKILAKDVVTPGT